MLLLHLFYFFLSILILQIGRLKLSLLGDQRFNRLNKVDIYLQIKSFIQITTNTTDCKIVYLNLIETLEVI